MRRLLVRMAPTAAVAALAVLGFAGAAQANGGFEWG